MMTATQCPTTHHLKALTLGQLSSEDSDALFEHIAECDRCRTELETVEDLDDSLVDSLRAPDEHAEFLDEPDCRSAVVKALGALALAENAGVTSDFDNLPRMIGEYEILRPIGRGGMGSVFLARHTKLGREVALKILSSHRLADPRMRERFEAEMRAVGRLSHPNIVTAHDAREVDGTAVLVTEYVSGLDLGQLLQRTGPLNVAEATEIARRVAVALAYTHSQGFVHRDVKPSNVMLSADGEIKLLDLGLARFQYGESERTEITGTGQVMGTADYVAPEQVTDSKSVDIRADIYALGCTLYKLLTGRAPFADDQHLSAFAKMTAHVSKTPPSLSTLVPHAPHGLVQLIDSMLAKDPEARPATPQNVANCLTPFCRGHNLQELITEALLMESRPATPPPASLSGTVHSASQSWLRRRVPATVAIAAGFLGLLLGIALSIIIVITNPDGTRSVLELAEGSTVEVREGASDAIDEVATEKILIGTNAVPLSFGILLNRDVQRTPSATAEQIAAATQLLKDSDGKQPVQTWVGIWYEATDDLFENFPTGLIQEQHAGKRFVLVSHEQSIGWPSIHSHVLSSTTRASGDGNISIRMHFDPALGKLFAQLTKQNIENHLAIIVNGTVRSAPRINSEIRDQAELTGVFQRGEAEQLSQWLHGGLVLPVPDKKEAGGFIAPKAENARASDEPKFAVYNIAGMDGELAYRIVSNLLTESPHTRLEHDGNSQQLILLANSSEHEKVKRILEVLNVSTPIRDATLNTMPYDSVTEFNGVSPFDGVWKILSVSDNGRERPTATGFQAACAFYGGRMAMSRNQGEPIDEADFEVVDAKSHHITIAAPGHDAMPGVFRFLGANRLELCLNEVGQERPTEFTSDVLIVMERVAVPNDKDERDRWLNEPDNAMIALAVEKYESWKAGN
ncbi:MAG: protein kinase [Pirellulaceae bacterium]